MAFKKFRSRTLSYKQQGFIYFTCLNYATQPERTRKRIDDICLDVAGPERYQALRDILVTGKSIRLAAIDCAIKGIKDSSERTLYNLKLKFYEKYADR